MATLGFLILILVWNSVYGLIFAVVMQKSCEILKTPPPRYALSFGLSYAVMIILNVMLILFQSAYAAIPVPFFAVWLYTSYIPELGIRNAIGILVLQFLVVGLLFNFLLNPVLFR